MRNTGVQRRLGTETSRRSSGVKVVGEIVAELRRVTWPTREETMRLTLMVVAVSAAVGVFLGLVDMGFARLINLILGN